MDNNANYKAQIEELKEKISNLQNKVIQTEDALNISQKRYQIAVEFSDVTIFDYNIKTKKIFTQPEDYKMFGMPGILEHGIEDVIDSGIIAERSKNDIRQLYNKIDNGAASASTTIHANALNNAEITLALKMVTIFDKNGEPAYAVGVRKDITDMVRFHKEKEYSNLLASSLTFIYEANVTQDKIIRYDKKWADDIGLGEIFTLSGVLELMCQNHIAPADAKMFYEKQCRSSLIEAFQKGERIISFEYRKSILGDDYMWFEVKINLVEDEITNDVNMRVYIQNIDNKKKIEMRFAAEHKQYELTVSKSVIIYEMNITKDTMKYIRDESNGEYDLFSGDNFSRDVLPLILNSIHPNERVSISNLLSHENLINAYRTGKIDLSREYRRVDRKGLYHWFRCSLQFFKDIQSDDILSYVYIEDIDSEKKKEIDLLYNAQHDLMTGFYNKKISEEKIDEFLLTSDGKNGMHAFFIIDLDHFKLVNDNFGHTFGDAVLSQTSAKISNLFRNSDIFGRIGGDEFIVFMKNVQNEKSVLLKAQEICDRVTEVYIHSNTEYKVTVSVGIAIYNKHGKTFDELYRHSDASLYEAKEHGRNCFAVYHSGINQCRTAINLIDKRQIAKIDTFESNISEYIFRILYESSDKQHAINAVLALFGKHYHFSRAYVFENSEDNKYMRNTFEWCNRGVEPQILRFPQFAYSDIGEYSSNFEDEGIFVLTDVKTMPYFVQEIMRERNVKSTVQFSILEKGKFVGFIGFDECSHRRSLSDIELNDYRNFANILGLIIIEMRALENIESARNIALSVVNGMDSYAYICEPDTYKILFVNVKTLGFAPNTKIGDCCYRVFWNRSEPCVECSMQSLIINDNKKFTKTIYKPSINTWLKVTASWVSWMNNKNACLIDATDITEFKPPEL